MFEKLKGMFGPSVQAASQLAPAAPPKVRPGSRAVPSMFKTAKAQGDSILPRDDRRLINKDLLTYRNGATTRQVMRDFAASSPDLSAAIFAYLRMAITSGYTAVARNPDGSANADSTMLLQQVLARFNVLSDYSTGFSGISSMQANSESMGKELLMYGALSCELVLDKSRLPYRIQPISVTNIEFKQDNDILKPVQRTSGDTIDLDIPTFFYASLDQDLLDPYASSPMEPALKATLFSEDFQNDLHRVMKRAIHPRQKVVINWDSFIEHAPAEAVNDQTKMEAYQASVLSAIESKINGLQPEDAVVTFDTIEISMDSNGNISLADEYKLLQEIGNSRLATGAKVLPAVLGHEVGSSNIASTSSMLFVKNATAVKKKLDEVYSRLLTLALRLFGHDVYVEFAYDDIDLRPATELESFYQTRQMRVLELLSLGMISDEEACLKLTGHLPPAGYKPLSGTMFKTTTATAQTSTPADSNSGSTLNQKLTPDAPATARGKNTNKGGDKAAELVRVV